MINHDDMEPDKFEAAKYIIEAVLIGEGLIGKEEITREFITAFYREFENSFRMAVYKYAYWKKQQSNTISQLCSYFNVQDVGVPNAYGLFKKRGC